MSYKCLPFHLILSIDDIEDSCQCYFSFLRVSTLRVGSTIGTLHHARWLTSSNNPPDHAGRGKNLKILHTNNIHELCHDGGLALGDAVGLSRLDWSEVFIGMAPVFYRSVKLWKGKIFIEVQN